MRDREPGKYPHYRAVKVLAVDDRPFHVLPFETVGERGCESRLLPFLHASTDGLPPEIDGVLVTSDLQGRGLAANSPPGRLLSEIVADEYILLSELGNVPPPDRVGVVLAGDLFAPEHLDRRGAGGSVQPMWAAFARRFHWVVGILGNHDELDPADLRALSIGAHPPRLLDGDDAERDGLRFDGLSGIVGNPRRPHRRDEAAYVRDLDRLLRASPDVLLLHEPPDVPSLGIRGRAAIRETLLARERGCLVVCGHDHWPVPLVGLGQGIQALNVDERVVLLGRPGGG